MSSDNIIQNLHYWALSKPNDMAAYCDGARLTWGELNKGAEEIAAGLAARGIAKNKRVGMLMRNRLEYMEAMLATLKCGGTIVLLNVRNTASEMRHPITDSDLDIILVDEEFLPAIAEVGNYAPRARVITSTPVAGYESINEHLRIADGRAPLVEVNGSDIAIICYTSGTTGTPKGAMISHAAICSAGAALTYVTAHNGRDRMLIPMLLSYTAGAVFYLRDSILAGIPIYYLSQPIAENMLNLIEKERITIVQGVGVLYDMMMHHPNFAKTDLSSLRHCVTGGASVSMTQLTTWMGRGVNMCQGYGQTEAAGSFISLLTVEDVQRKMGFAGRPMPNCEVKIVNEAGETLPPNTVGEIWVRTSAIMSGYLNRPEESAAALAGGWLHTGDLGLLDEEHFLKIVDRNRDMLISGGLNVYPAEIEKVLAGQCGMEEMAVIGVPDARWGEVPMIVTSQLERVDLEALAALSVRELADYKRPRYIVDYGQPLPRTYSGKITKPVLREAFADIPAHAKPMRTK